MGVNALKRSVVYIVGLALMLGCAPKYDLNLDTPSEGQGKVTDKSEVETEAAIFDEGETDQSRVRFGKYLFKRIEVEGTSYAVGYNEYENFAKVNKGDIVYFYTYGKGVLVKNDMGSYDTYRMVKVTPIEANPKAQGPHKPKTSGSAISK